VSIVNALAREIAAKVVYYGPGLSGKTTSLKQVYAGIRPETRGQLISLSTEGDRTLFFDFLPVKIEPIGGLGLRLQLYTVPGQVFYDATRKLVLNGADGVVFVADSQPSAADSNIESMGNLETNLAEMGIELASFPLVLQYNKRDLPGAVAVEELRAQLNRWGAPEFETVASRGEGILPALREITRLVVKDLKGRQPQRAPARPAAPRPGEPPSRTPAPVAVPPAPMPLAAAAAAAAASAPPSPVRPIPGGLSLARLFGENGGRVAEVELLIRERSFGRAARRASEGLAELLAGLTFADPAPGARALLLGLDGRDVLRLAKLAAMPEGQGTEREALFALHVLVSAMLKAEEL
jgi:signal recognition particle receptor subunit beta